MSMKARFLKPALAAMVLGGATVIPMAAHAQMVVTVTPARPGVAGAVLQNGQPVPADALFNMGPRYTVPSGIRVGRGTEIPNWVELATFQNVSIDGLNPYGYYGFYVSPDDKIVVVDLSSKRVRRVLGH